MLRLALIVFFLLDLEAYNFNSHGNLGYINTPSAYTLDENSYSLNSARNKPERRYTLTASPFNWLDASIFYVDITRKPYGGGFMQSYKDKGFNLKLSPLNIFGHQLGLGLNDLAGTGIFQSEYIVLSNSFRDIEYSFGIAWGSFDKGIVVDNPLSRISSRFNERPFITRDRGGNFDYKKYFSGRKSSLFFGGIYQVNDDLSLIFELDPTDTEFGYVPYKKKLTKFNFGFSHEYKDFYFKYSFQRGKTFGVQITYHKDSSKFNAISTKQNSQQILTPQDLQDRLRDYDIGLKNISTDSESLLVDIRQNSYFDQRIVDNIVLENANNLARLNQLSEVTVRQYYQGMEVSNQNYSSKNQSPTQKVRKLDSSTIFNVKETYPYFFSKTYPSIRNFIAGREAFYFGGVFIQNDSELIVEENIFILTNLKYSIWDNFDNLVYPPVDVYPEQVRSDNKDYYKNFRENLIIGRLEINYFKSPVKDHYFRTSIGLFEEMFGGYGVDYVYAPEESIFAIGLEAYHLKKREYDMQFKFKDYSNNIYRAAIQVQEPNTDVRIRVSFGEYIAGDKGYTFEAKRQFKNGVEFGVFFSRTNVSKELYGEGSFDKGITVRIPIPSFFGGNDSLSSYEWRPLTKDPASLLIKSIDLMDQVDRYRFY